MSGHGEPSSEPSEQERLARAFGDAPTRDLGTGPTRHGADLLDRVEKAQVFEALFGTPAEPQQLGRYVVLGPLGSGGMGMVLEAFDRTLDRRVALKVLHQRDLSEEHAARLLREAQALAKLSHPNVVQVYEVGQASGQAFIAMELVRGRSLREWLRQDPRPSWQACVQVFLQAGEGLAAAHARGLVHRDFKPGNAVIDDEGRVRVLDFGLARRIEEEATQASQDVEGSGAGTVLEQSLTQTGAVLGTPAYMAPEQMRGLEADARSDQLGFCVALYEALYGERPFEGESMPALLASMISGRVRPAPRASAVPVALRAAVLRGLRLEPEARWPSMEALLVQLRRVVSPRRRGWLALGVVGGMVAIGLGLWQYAEVGLRCGGAREHLEGIWDDARRQAVKDAILGTGLSYAPDTWERVERGLDEYAAAWADAHTEICEATSVRQEQSAEVMDLRMGCLGDRRVELREAVSVLAQADRTRVEKAVGLVAGLPGLARCDDVEALRSELPPPEDPQVAAEVEALRERLAQVRALNEVGEYDDALTRAEAVVEQAEGLPYAPLLAEALLTRSWTRGALGQYVEAEQDAERAYLLAARHGHRGVEAKAVGLLVMVVGVGQARHEPSLQWGRTALALAEARPFDPELQARTLASIGLVKLGQGKPQEALTHFQRALVLDERALGPRHPAVAERLDAMGAVLMGQGKLEEALTHMQRGLATREQALGPRHPLVAISLSNIGTVLTEQGKLEDALSFMERALTIEEEALGARHPFVAMSLANIGSVLKRQGKLEEALTHMQRALAMWEQALGPRHPDVAGSLHNIGGVLGAQGKLEDARAHVERALDIWEEALGARHPRVASARLRLAEIALQQHEADAAREHAERAVSIGESSETSPDVLAQARFVLAQALWPDGSQRTRARALAERARDAYAELGEPKRELLAKVEVWLAEHAAP